MSMLDMRNRLLALFAGQTEAEALRPVTRTIELQIAASADSATTLAPAGTAARAMGFDGEIVAAYVTQGTAITGQATNYATYKVSKYVDAGTVSTTPLALALSASTVTVSAFDGKAMTLTDSLRQFSAGDVLVGWVDKTGTGLSTNAGSITVVYRDR